MSVGTGDISFDIENIQTETLSIPKDLFTPNKSRRFFISASDGRITHSTSRIKLNGRSLRWNETLAGFSARSSSQLTLHVLEEHKIRKNKLLATFVMSYEMLCLSRNEFLLSTTPNTSSCTLALMLSTRSISLFQADHMKGPRVGSSTGMEVVIGDRVLHPHEVVAVVDFEPSPTLVTGASVTTSDGVEKDSGPGKGVENQFIHKWKMVRERVGFLAGAMITISEIHLHAQFAWTAFSFIPETISEEIQPDDHVTHLFDGILEALHLAPGNEILDDAKLKFRCEHLGKCQDTVKNMMNLITECGYFIQQYAKDDNFRKQLTADDKKNFVSKYREQLKQLQSAFLDENTTNVDISLLRILGHTESIADQLDDLHLDTKFPFVQGARFNPEKGCLPGTRIKFLEAIMNWVNDVSPSSPRALVLFGQAGTGKSSIAHEIAKRLHHTERLTTSYCFVRGKPSSREPHRFFTTLARNLSTGYPAFKASLSRTLRKNPEILMAEDFTTLLRSLILEPLRDIQFVGPVVIVIDALDESEDASGGTPHTSDDQVPFHTFLGQHLPDLPSTFRILMTTRPEAQITASFPPSPFTCHIHMDDPELSGGVDDDILAYLRTRLQVGRAIVEDNNLRKLAKKAEQLFQWAAVASHYIANPPPGLDSKGCIRRVLDPPDGKRGLNPLDALYITVLERFDMDDPDICNRFQSVMGRILGVYQPLSMSSFNTMYQYTADDDFDADEPENVFAIVEHLGSLLSNVTTSNSEYPVFPLHTSFRDFLTNPNRSGKFYVNPENAHQDLAYATLRTMQEMLWFNICGIETSYGLNSDVPNLSDRIETCISPALSYSCRFWADHIARVSRFDLKSFNCVKIFMEEKFFFWLEVLSMKGELSAAAMVLTGLRTWLGKMCDIAQNEGMSALDPLAKDAIAFVEYFGYPMAQSVPHIYLSALPFAPSSSLIARVYSPQFPRTLKVKCGRLVKWPALVRDISVPNKPNVVCIAWSRSDEYIAGGLHNGDILVWNVSMGTRVSGPFSTGRQDRVFASSIVFSHDGLCLASGLSDGRIRIWHLVSGEEAVELGGSKDTGHTAAVSAVSFSQNGKLLVSGSVDHTIRIWNLEKRKTVAGPFLGHENPIWAVSFLPDQEHVMSRSGFRTVRIWNIRTGQIVSYPFNLKDAEIPTGTIESAVHYDTSFFHDESRLKSSFSACSWSEAMECQEVEYRAGFWTQAAAVSCNGKFIATSSSNHTHIWHAHGESAGMLAGGPFANVNAICLAFSADGQRIATGLENGILRVWHIVIVDQDLSRTAAQPLTVTFTPDGKQIVVGRHGGTVQLLDAPAGHEVLKIRDENKEHVWPKVAVSLKGNLIASTRNDELLIWTRKQEVVTEPLIHNCNEQIWCVAFSPDANDLIVFGTRTGSVGVFNASTGTLLAGPKQISDDGVASLALFSSTIDTTTATMQTRVAVGTLGKMFAWDVASGNVISPSTDHSSWVTAIVFSKDGRYITSVAQDYAMCVWDSTTGSVVKRCVGFSDEQKAYLGDGRYQYIALTQDGQRVAFIGKHLTILVFEVLITGNSEISLQGPLVLGGHAGILKGMAFSRDGQLLATTSEDRTIRIWNLLLAADQKQSLVNAENTEIPSFDEAFIDDDGWAVGTTRRGRSPLRLVWIPEMHRKTLNRPTSMCVVIRDRQVETSLDLENFVHGKEWIKCKA